MAIDKKTDDKVTLDNAQFQRFVETAYKLEADEDEARWDATLKKVVAPKPNSAPKPK